LEIPEFYSRLFRKYLDNECSPQQVEDLFRLIADPSYMEYTRALIQMHTAKDPDDLPVDAALNERLAGRLQLILGQAPVIPMHRKRRFARFAIAASILLSLSAATAYLLSHRPKRDIVQTAPANNDIPPGGNRAILTLADGKRIVLDSVDIGTVATQGESRVEKTGDGHLAYTVQQTPNNTETVYNTLSTPRGGQQQLTLPDGSRVWLNSVSSISFPTAFTGDERRVELMGEAYFEIAKNAKQPFRVIVDKREQVDVLGTDFNVNAYPDEAEIKTTLLNGSIRLSKDNASILMKPGQQALLPGNGKIQLIAHADIEQAVGWKDGKFIFKGTNIRAIMRQAARWYDIDPMYEAGTDSLDFSGEISRKENISQLLQLLEATGTIRFSIQGKKVIVKP